jgi:membrane fusion protein (multidrug efflux system)
MAVDFVVNEKQLPHFEKIFNGQEGMPDSLFTILMPDNSLYPYQGKISVIDRAVDPQTGSIRIRTVFENPKHDLKAGMSCVLRVHNQDIQPQLVIPARAVVEQMGEYFVYVAKDTIINANKEKTGGNTDSGSGKGVKDKSDTSNRPKLVAVERKVQTGQTIGPDIIIKSGIEEGDKVVVDGVQTLHSGSRITTANKVAPSSGKGGKGQ